MFFSIFFDRTELCLFAFKRFNMIHLVRVNNFYEFGSIGPNPKKHKKNANIRVYGTIEQFQSKYATVLSSRKVLKFHCIRLGNSELQNS